MVSLGVYLHIPFCVSKCHYCDFNSFPLEDGGLVERYCQALLREMEMAAGASGVAGRPVESVYVGGGTPTCLPGEQLAGLLERCRELFALVPGAEVTVEANPGTVDAEKLAVLRQAGCNRLSLGFQALQDRLLRVAGRAHTASQCREAYQAACEAGFTNVNVDLIFGLPGQTLEDWRETLEQVAVLRPEHVAAYNLKVEPGTLFYRLREQGALGLPAEEEECAMIDLAGESLGGHGYVHYEISNHALPGRQSAHNLRYWRNEEYLGLGAGAFSYLHRRRYHNLRRPETYTRRLERGESPVAGAEEVPVLTEMSDTAILGLRLVEGFSLARFEARFGIAFQEAFAGAWDRLTGLGLLEVVDGWARLTPRGRQVANQAWLELV